MRELLIATTNQGKLREIKELLKDFPLKITSLKNYPDLPDVVEDGETFEANAIKKAVTIGRETGKLVMGEDSGLEVKALNNEPGIYSARFAGSKDKNAADQRNNDKLLEVLKDVPDDQRQARYRCLAALADGEKVIGVVEGLCEGAIARGESGENGFGYDPLFYLPQYQKTFGELDPAIKSRISHRAHALEKIKELLSAHLSVSTD